MKKGKWFVLTLGFILCIAVLGVGVFAASLFKLDVKGNIEFVVFDKQVYIEQIEVKNYAETTDGGQTYALKSKVLDGYNGRYLSSANLVATIDVSQFSVSEDVDLTIEIKMKSLSASSLSVVCEFNTVSGVSISTSNTVLSANPEGKVSTGVSDVFSVVVSNEGSEVVSLDPLDINILFEDRLAGLEARFETAYVGETSQVDYYYLTMGTFNGEPVRWRYVSEDCKTPYDVSKGVPKSVRGYYIIETEAYTGINSAVEYVDNYSTSSNPNYHPEPELSDIYINDYATTEVRDYLNRTENGLMSFLNISQEDAIYKAITPQSLENLYKESFIEAECTEEGYNFTISDIPEALRSGYSSLATDANFNKGTDKFFAPSYKEILDLNISMDWCHYPDEWDSNILSFGYWTRSMVREYSYMLNAAAEGVGYLSVNLLFFESDSWGTQARAAFVIS